MPGLSGFVPGQLLSFPGERVMVKNAPPGGRHKVYLRATSVTLWHSPGTQRYRTSDCVDVRSGKELFLILARVAIDDRSWYLLWSPAALGWTPKIRNFELVRETP